MNQSQLNQFPVDQAVEVFQLTPDAQDELRKNSGTSREECLRLVVGFVGESGVPAFLQARQSALGDRTGAELLHNDSRELLRRLQALEFSSETFDDELVGDPAVERFAKQWKRSQGNRVLDILDGLDRIDHE
jgi:hypothetical protein